MLTTNIPRGCTKIVTVEEVIAGGLLDSPRLCCYKSLLAPGATGPQTLYQVLLARQDGEASRVLGEVRCWYKVLLFNTEVGDIVEWVCGDRAPVFVVDERYLSGTQGGS